MQHEPLTKAKPTNTDLRDQINKVHDCVHRTGLETNKRIDAVADDVAYLKGAMTALVATLGVRPAVAGDEPTPRKIAPLGMWGPWKALWAVATAAAAGAGAWKVIVGVGVPALKALNHVLLNMG